MKRSFALNLTEKFESNKKSQINKNESYGCLIDHQKKASEFYPKKNNKYLSIHQKLMKRNKSHANHFDGVRLLNFNSINKQKHGGVNRQSICVKDHQRIHSSHKVLNQPSPSHLIKNVICHENNNDLMFMDKSIEVDGDLYNEEHANLYQDMDGGSCHECIKTLLEIKSNCDACKSSSNSKDILVSGRSFETCTKCVKILVEKQIHCICSSNQRNRQITFGKQTNKLFNAPIGESIKDLDQLDYIEMGKDKSMKIKKSGKAQKKNNSDNFDYKNTLNQADSFSYLVNHQNHNSMLESSIKPHLELDSNHELKKELFKNSNLKNNQFDNNKNFFISSPLNNQKTFKYSQKRNHLNNSNNPYNLNMDKDQESFIIGGSGNSSSIVNGNFHNNSSKLQIKINENKKIRNELSNFSKKNILNSLQKKLRGKLNVSNNAGIHETNLSKKLPKHIKLSTSHTNQDKNSIIKELKSFNQIEISHREKSHNPFNGKNKLMKRNHTTKNLRQFEFQSFKPRNNPGKTQYSYFLI